MAGQPTHKVQSRLDFAPPRRVPGVEKNIQKSKEAHVGLVLATEKQLLAGVKPVLERIEAQLRQSPSGCQMELETLIVRATADAKTLGVILEHAAEWYEVHTADDVKTFRRRKTGSGPRGEMTPSDRDTVEAAIASSMGHQPPKSQPKFHKPITVRTLTGTQAQFAAMLAKKAQGK
eukprot:NODE_1481_length_842_cov_89.180420_g1433_i0.p1 GENE.NODE_1481_length_842_cov_89.180420_g1433_i0~~NODE_1481_length_842_cov_89.180420_g1433_i0.p1  ORF type:complete len:176 (-),score=22.52 NODE_1481_length_842_cov_89.180420_g1433_i0:135-662(-)